MTALPEQHGATAMMIEADTVNVDDLRELMTAVTETSQRLQQTHRTLQSEVTRLQSELAAANAQLKRSRDLAALGEMAAGIAHEIRNPLASIQLYIQMLRDDLGDRPEQSVCEKIERAVRGLDGIVRDVLLFARETRMSPERIAVDELIGQTLTSCDALIAQWDGVVEVEVGGDLTVNADGHLVSQALANLLRNAVEATPVAGATGRIRLTATQRSARCPGGRRAERLVLAVEDTGPGIAPEIVERMFNPFFTTRPTGTGLGLAIVHRIIEAHGGHVNVTDGALGGARIELYLPVESARSEVAGSEPMQLNEVATDRRSHTSQTEA